MRWRQARQSRNVEDRRGRTPARRGATIGGGGLLLVLVYVLLGGDAGTALQLLGGTSAPAVSS